MLYICPKCGEKFNVPDRQQWKGDAWNCCPNCGEPDYEPAFECACCGEDFLEKDLIGGVCAECLEAEPFAWDYLEFAHDDQMRECFAEWLTEKYGALWKERRKVKVIE